MKALIPVIIIALGQVPGQEALLRKGLLCKTWRQVGFQAFNGQYNQVDLLKARLIQFKADGSYQEQRLAMHLEGFWRFYEDSTKILVSLTKPKQDMYFRSRKPLDQIILLTADSLVVRNERNYYYFIAVGQ